MKKFGILLMAMSLVANVAFAAGSGSGGALPPADADPVVVVEVVAEVEPVVVVEVETVVEAVIEPVVVVEAEPVVTSLPEVTETVVVEAPVAEVAPVVEAAVSYCHDLGDRPARIRCRLQKSADDLKAEFAVRYMPEECAALGDDADCAARYKSLYPCWAEDPGSDRIKCVKRILDLPQKLVSVDDFCGEDAGCRDEYVGKVHNLIKYRMYDAEERAQKFYEAGRLDLDVVVDFVDFIAESKGDFNNARTKAERVAVIKDVMKEWKKVVSKVQ
ncbi:hypothetical protein JKY72_03215 [Candidatus Gracilibacteria bacterium]|nr:hypothetical protein [Candidatus Gracilibacteria bacterium]